MPTVVVILLMTLAFSAGGVLLKQFALSNGAWWLLGAVLAYTAGNALYIHILRAHDLGVATIVSALAQIILLSLAGRLFFSESLSATQIAGTILGVAALALVMLPAART